MKFGVNTLIWSIRFEADRVPFARLREAGADGVEAPAFDPGAFDRAGFRSALAEHGLEGTLCSICPADGHPGSDDPASRRRALEHWRAAIELAGELGVKLLAGPSYAPVGYLPGRRRTEDEWARAVDFHRGLAELLEQADVVLAVEPINRFETYFLNTAADAVRFVEEIGSERIGILLDTFHSNIEDKSVAAAYRRCGARLKHVHTCENDRGIPGSGHVPWTEVREALAEIGYDGWLTIESFNANAPELSAATAIWRDLAPTTDEIALRGVRFLRTLWAAAAR